MSETKEIKCKVCNDTGRVPIHQADGKIGFYMPCGHCNSGKKYEIDDITKERSRPHKGTYDEQEERIIGGPVKELDRYLIKIQIFKEYLNYRLKFPNDNFYNGYNRKYYSVKTPEDVIKLFEDACDCPVELI